MSFDGKSKRCSSITNPCGACLQYTTQMREVPPPCSAHQLRSVDPSRSDAPHHYADRVCLGDRPRPRARQTAVKTAAGAPWQIPPPCSRQALSRSTEGCGKRPVAQRVSSSGGRPTGGVYSGDGASFGHRLGHDNEARYMGPQWLEMTHLKGHSMEGLP